MRSNYKKLGQFIKEVSVKNKDLSVELLLGVSITKQFIPSIANTVGTDMSKYKVVEHHQFAYGPVTSRNGEKISVALLSEEKCIVSTSYTVFEIVDTELLDPEYLIMWFRRSEFDRYARYMSHGTVRELFGWQEMCDVELPVPSIEKQREIVREYNVVNDRIALNEQLTQKLEDTAQTIYKQWFVDFEFPISKEYAQSIGKPELEGKPYKSSGGEMEYCEVFDKDIPLNWQSITLDDIASFQNGYGFKSDMLLDQNQSSDLDCYSVFKMGHIKKGGGFNLGGTKSWIDKSSSIGLEQFLLKRNDLLMAMTDMKESIGLLGNTAMMLVSDMFILNQRVGLIRPKNAKGVGYATLYCVTNSPAFLQDLRSRANIGVQVNLTKSAIMESKLLIADKSLNNELELKLRVVLDRVNIITNQKVYLEQLKSLLLSKISKV